jgi:hypothetical protein
MVIWWIHHKSLRWTTLWRNNDDTTHMMGSWCNYALDGLNDDTKPSMWLHDATTPTMGSMMILHPLCGSMMQLHPRWAQEWHYALYVASWCNYAHDGLIYDDASMNYASMLLWMMPLRWWHYEWWHAWFDDWKNVESMKNDTFLRHTLRKKYVHVETIDYWMIEWLSNLICQKYVGYGQQCQDNINKGLDFTIKW